MSFSSNLVTFTWLQKLLEGVVIVIKSLTELKTSLKQQKRRIEIPTHYMQRFVALLVIVPRGIFPHRQKLNSG